MNFVLRRTLFIGLSLLLVGVMGPRRSEARSEYPEIKNKMATVALFGLGGAGLGLVTVAASSDPQSRLGNISAGLLVGAIAGTIYVFAVDAGSDSKMSFVPLPMPGGAQAQLMFRF